jgi:TatD DNase family protein
MTGQFPVAGVDFHCHLDLYPDHAGAIARAEAAQVYTLTVTTTPKAWPRNRDLTRDTSFVRAALGLHPQLVEGREAELATWESYLSETRYIGEVGLDAGPRFYKSLEAQKRVFKTMLSRCADAGDKILTIHSVRSAPAVLELIEKHLPPSRGATVLHWFTGSRSDARRAIELGCLFSINIEMVGSERAKALLADLPLDRLLTETDGPFTEMNGRPSQPEDVRDTVLALAALRGMSANALARALHANLRRLVG